MNEGACEAEVNIELGDTELYAGIRCELAKGHSGMHYIQFKWKLAE